jgi:hypothetical protein
MDIHRDQESQPRELVGAEGPLKQKPDGTLLVELARPGYCGGVTPVADTALAAAIASMSTAIVTELGDDDSAANRLSSVSLVSAVSITTVFTIPAGSNYSGGKVIITPTTNADSEIYVYHVPVSGTAGTSNAIFYGTIKAGWGPIIMEIGRLQAGEAVAARVASGGAGTVTLYGRLET